MISPESPEPADSSSDGLPPLAPDFVEQNYPELIDNVVPTRGYRMAPMVGLGGSAGSIKALLEFFKAMPPDTGMVFVVILHLSPSHESSMAHLLSGATSMKVKQATDGELVELNHVYVIPPGKYISAVDGHLRLTELENERGRRVAVDVFFRSLADSHGPHSAAIVLSGADGDGAIGIKRIKERGGLTIAQDPDEAEFDSMPRTSIETGMVDWVLQVRQMPGRLVDYQNLSARLKLPAEEGPTPAHLPEPVVDDGEMALREVLFFLRMRTGRDFAYYKRATILRRIGRRMQVNGVDNLSAYLDVLRTHPGESGALLQDLLISVTNFFRDPAIFKTIEGYIPELFKDKTPTDTVRVWVPACATGEEAYSFAMLLLEHARTIESPPALQVFACDLDAEAIQKARAGYFLDAITADVSDERLRKFFVKEAKGYRARRELREMILFASHDLLKDAPFSRMDLISCRNLLIYLTRDAQQRVFDLFHFSLKPGGILLLGSSESVEDGNPLFRVLDKKQRIYARQQVGSVVPMPLGASSLLRTIDAQERSRTLPVVMHGKQFTPEPLAFHNVESQLDRVSLAELHFKLLERYAPPSVIVNHEHNIVHLSPHAGEYLRFVGGEPTANLLRVVHPALRIELRSALFRAAETTGSVQSFDVPGEIEGHMNVIRVTVAPAVEMGPGFLLVTFQNQPGDAAQPLPARSFPTVQSDAAVRQLDRELEQLKLNLRDTVEQYEASTDELKASNEELQAMNEELRSATEELETSREELQSINEELTTVNQEMKTGVEEVARVNSDLQNLISSTSMATVFLDRELAISRFTPPAAAIFNMIPGDLGRPLAHLKHRLEYPELIADAQQVLKSLVPLEREVGDGTRFYLARINPYRTIDDRIAGVVLTLIDISDRVHATEAMSESEERMRILIESAKDYAIFTIGPDRRIDSWSKGAETLFGYAESDILGQLADILYTPEDRAGGAAEREAETALESGRAENERWHSRRDGSVFYGSGSVMPLRDKAGKLRGFVKIIRDLTESKRTQEALQDDMTELTRINADSAGRESRTGKLIEEINDLCRRLGEEPRYAIEPNPPEGPGKPPPL